MKHETTATPNPILRSFLASIKEARKRIDQSSLEELEALAEVQKEILPVYAEDQALLPREGDVVIQDAAEEIRRGSMETETKTPEQFLEELAGIVCPDCNGSGEYTGEADACNAPGDPCDPCHETGRRFWRLVRECPNCEGTGMIHGRGNVLFACPSCVSLPRGSVYGKGQAKGTGYIPNATLDALIDTALDLGHAPIFTPDEWEQHLPEQWINVRRGSKVEDLLRALDRLLEREINARQD